MSHKKRLPGHARNSLCVEQRTFQEEKLKLKKKISKIAESHKSLSYSIYQNLNHVVPQTENLNKAQEIYKKLTNLPEETENLDQDFVLDEEKLNPLKRPDMAYISTYPLNKYFKEKNFEIFNKVSINGQVLRDRRCSYVVDTLNTLSTQPGILMRLFDKIEINKAGIYIIWININGSWSKIVVDDVVPIYGNKNGKAQFLHISPNTDEDNLEIWMILVFKALAKAYGGYHNLYNGNQNYLLKDLTGAPVTVEPIIHIHERQKLTEREHEHMNNLWENLRKSLKRGYPLAVSPRPPTEHEVARNNLLSFPNKNFFLDKGIYYGHTYAIVTIKELEQSNEEGKVRLVKLRNPWINEKWTGDWCFDSENWTEELRDELNYHKEGNEFWIPLRNLMYYFEDLIICQAQPNYIYSNCPIIYPNKNFVRAVVRLRIEEKGKYSISLDQKDPTFLGSRDIKNLPVKLSLCKLEDGVFKLLSYTSSNSLRNTFIRKLIEKGDYFILVEQNSLSYERKLANQDIWRNVNLTTYGPRSCGMKVIECEEIHIIHDFLLYESWKSFAEERIGRRVSSFNLTFDDGHQGSLAIHMLNIPNTVVYVFNNENDYGVDINTEMLGIDNLEVVGPEGKVGFSQHFKIDSRKCDIFIMRQTEKNVENPSKEKQKFQVKSIVGSRYKGDKKKSQNQCKVYEFLLNETPIKRKCLIEKHPELIIYSLYDEEGRLINLEEFKNKEIKVKKRSVVQAPRASSKALVENNLPHDTKSEKSKSVPPKVPRVVEKKNQEEVDNFKVNQAEKIDSREVSEIVARREEYEKRIGNLKQHDGKEVKKKKIGEQKKVNLARFLGMRKEEILNQKNEDILELINYTGLDAFCGLYNADQDYLDELYKKLEKGISVNSSLKKTLQIQRNSNDIFENSSPNFTLKNDSSIYKEKKANKLKRHSLDSKGGNQLSGGLNGIPPVFFYTESNQGDLNSHRNLEIESPKPSSRDEKDSVLNKKLFQPLKEASLEKTDEREERKSSNFMTIFSKQRSEFRRSHNSNQNSQNGKTTEDDKLSKIKIPEEKLKNSIVKNHLKNIFKIEGKNLLTPINKNRSRRNVFKGDSSERRTKSNNILNNNRNLPPMNSTPMKPFLNLKNNNIEKRESEKDIRSISPNFQTNGKRAFNFFNTPTEGIQIPNVQIPASNLHFYSTRGPEKIEDKATPDKRVDNNFNNYNGIRQGSLNQPSENSNYNMSSNNQNRRVSPEQMTDLTLRYLRSKPQNSIGNISVGSYRAPSLNKIESSPPYKLLKTNKMNPLTNSNSLVTTIGKRGGDGRIQRSQFQEIQRRFLNKISNAEQDNLRSESKQKIRRGYLQLNSREGSGLKNGNNFLETFAGGNLESELQDIDNGGAIVDLKLVQNSITSSNKLKKNDFMGSHFSSTQENIFNSSRKMNINNLNMMRISDRNSLDSVQFRNNSREKTTPDPQIFSFRNQNILNNQLSSISRPRTRSKDILKESIPVFKLNKMRNKSKKNLPSGEVEIPYEGEIHNPGRQEEYKNNLSPFIPMKMEYHSISSQNNNTPLLHPRKDNRASYESYNSTNGQMSQISSTNFFKNQVNSLINNSSSRSKSRNYGDKINFDIGKNFGNFTTNSVRNNHLMSQNTNVMRRPREVEDPRRKASNRNISKRSYEANNQRENRYPSNSVNNFMDQRSGKKNRSVLSRGFKPEVTKNLGVMKFSQKREGVNGGQRIGIKPLNLNRRSYNF